MKNELLERMNEKKKKSFAYFSGALSQFSGLFHNFSGIFPSEKGKNKLFNSFFIPLGNLKIKIHFRN